MIRRLATNAANSARNSETAAARPNAISVARIVAKAISTGCAIKAVHFVAFTLAR